MPNDGFGVQSKIVNYKEQNNPTTW